MSFLSSLLGNRNGKTLKSYAPIVERVRGFHDAAHALSDEDIRSRYQALKADVQDGKQTLDEVLPEVFALTREAAARTVSMEPYDVQIVGGLALHNGTIAEMRTGEGKTLVATLPLILNAMTGKGTHLVTVNDYLARRDAIWMGAIYHFLGLSIGCIQHDQAFLYDPSVTAEDESMENLRLVDRREAYAADITYGTNNEFGFDYLRDNMAIRLDQRVQRELTYAIVDEVDSILVDEARTPLIISGPADESTDLYTRIASLVPQLEENTHYNIDEKLRAVTLTEAGIERMEQMLSVPNLYEEGGVKLVHHIDQALKAHALFKRDKDYVVREGEVVIVDEFTGRLMEGRRYSEGLHQAIEAKEHVDIKQENRTYATITFQNLFRMYGKLAGMTGTAETESEEFYQIYGLDVVIIPTNKPTVRKDNSDLIYKTEKAKYEAVVAEVKKRHDAGQPVLIGTVSIEKNELMGELLQRAGVPHEILNAKNHTKEASIIAQAGRAGAVTLATNMAGRGVDIILGGKPYDTGRADEVRAAGGLHVIGTERHESRRIDNQLRGRAGRQGDPGSSQFFVSTDDDLMRIFGGSRIRSVMDRLRLPDDMPIENRMISRSIESAQKKVEGHNFDIRKHLVQYDDVINKQRTVIYKRRTEVLKADTGEGSDSTRNSVLDMIRENVTALVSMHTASERIADWNVKEIAESLRSMIPSAAITEEELVKLRDADRNMERARGTILDATNSAVEAAYAKLESTVNDPAMLRDLEKQVILRTVDGLWVEHLDNIEYLRTGIGLRGYAQRDPLVEYKKESFAMFNELLASIQSQVANTIFKIGGARTLGGQQQLPRNIIEIGSEKTMKRGKGQFSQVSSTSVPQSGAASSTAGQPAQRSEVPNTIIKDGALRTNEGEKIGRNDPCPCGSGKKYKKCHGQ